MKLLISFSQIWAADGPIRIRALDGCVSAFLLGFAMVAQAEPVSTLDQQVTFGDDAILASQGFNTKLAQATPMGTDMRGDTSSAAGHPSVDAICDAIAAAAAHDDLPLGFFTRLIWQESRFDPLLVSSKGARGIAQFMPATASWRGLRNPFDPLASIPKAAQLLNELRREFGNIGLAAAAYNAGPQRVRQWLARRQSLPRETQQYVRVVTGQRVEEWTVSTTAAPVQTSPDIPCRPDGNRVATAPSPAAQISAAVTTTSFGWVVQLIGQPSRVLATLAWGELKQKYAGILADREPLFAETKLSGGMSWYRVRIGTDGLERAKALCAQLENAGASCLVQRN
jgi:hypothetical protein